MFQEKRKNMNKIMLKDGTTYEIAEGTGIHKIIIASNTYDEIEGIEKAFSKTGNLETVKFLSNDEVTGEYENLKLMSNVFDNVRTEDEKVIIEIGLREMTDMEVMIDNIQKEQEIQDAAIADLGDAVSDITPEEEQTW